MANIVCVPVSSEIVAEFLLRRPKADLSGWFEDVLSDYLARTQDDPRWTEAYRRYKKAEAIVQDLASAIGDPVKGYLWKQLFLPNGTKLKMTYKGKAHYAEVLNDSIHYQGETLSPSELAMKIAEGTNRNAWRDLYIKRPRDDSFTLASTLRDRI